MAALYDNDVLIDKAISPHQQEILLEAYDYIGKVTNMEIWNKLLRAFNKWFNISEETLNKIIDIFTKLDQSSLLMDDIANQAEVRNGIPAAHLTFGIPNTLNTYYYAISQASIIVADFDDEKAANIYSECMMNNVKARRMQYYWRDNLICPTEEQYIRTLAAKRGSLFTAVAKYLQLFSANKLDVVKVVQLMSVYFELVEDYKRLKDNTNPESKTYALDVTCGNFTFPLIHLINTNSRDGEIVIEILRQHSKEMELKKYVVYLLEQNGSFDYTVKRINEVSEEINNAVKKLGDNTLMSELIKEYFTF